MPAPEKKKPISGASATDPETHARRLPPNASRIFAYTSASATLCLAPSPNGTEAVPVRRKLSCATLAYSRATSAAHWKILYLAPPPARALFAMPL
ncbi:hypothetical protein SAURM35S_00054 [Streptomyces aurantiogriseus]